MEWNKLPTKKEIEETIRSLKGHGITAHFFENRDEARDFVFSLMPKNADIMNMTSVTLETLGIDTEINESGKYNSVRNRLNSMNRQTQNNEMQKLGAAPDWVIGSVHAVTHDGKLVIASMSGSQLPAYVYGASKVIFVVGAQKIVKDLDQAIERIYQHSLVLESERAKKAYGVPGSEVNKILIINKDIQKDRITLIIIKEVLGF